MRTTYEKWDTRSNAPVSLLSNSYVNYFSGVSLTQTTPSPVHILPKSFEGKKFHINNEVLSSYPVSVMVNTQNGAERFDITPGDSAVFVYIGNNIWDQTAGEQIIRDLIGKNTDRIISRTINYFDSPDTLTARYTVGTIPSGYSVKDISIDIAVAFNDPSCDTLQLEISQGPTTILSIQDVDIKRAGIYEVRYPFESNPVSGTVDAVFNLRPNDGGGNQGIAHISIHYVDD